MNGLKYIKMKKYDVIYADPPWDVKMFKRKTRPNQQKHAYPMMKLDDIKKLPIDNMTKDTSILFLWTTQGYLKQAFDVLDEWGFNYQRTITWDKQNGMCLYGFHHRTEFILVGRKGNLPKFPKRKTIPTMIQISSKKLRHSEKPREIRGMIEVFGDDRIELFARKEVNGWDCFGNEVENSIDLSEYYT